ncbi:hypothetical protein NBRC116590_04410 [Pelagimonas sp. KU-00592-HH]|uniref:DUF2199 domain-containing protein n=1 Tax=Pelagimonas sp. KU-00592-HH TaxID=3127651 RepID=UPI003104585F
MNLLALDARWRRLHDETRVCPQSGRRFNGIFDIGYDHPDSWPHGDLAEAGAPDLQVGEDRLSSDLCRIDEDRFLKCVLPLPIRGSDEVFFFGPWASVPPDTFYAYIDEATGAADGFEGGEAWLMNDLPGFESEDPIACALQPGDAGQRPVLIALSGPLAEAQENGISFDQLLDIYAASGDDIRPFLMAD